MSEGESAETRWNNFVTVTEEYRTTRQSVFRSLVIHHTHSSPENDPILNPVRASLADNRYEAALFAVSSLPQAYHQVLFDELVVAALEWNVNNGRNPATDLLVKLPQEWVRDHFCSFVDRLLLCDASRLTTSLLELCEELDPDLGLILAQRALASADQYLREIGEHFTRRFTTHE
jgi:hypothetical protein